MRINKLLLLSMFVLPSVGFAQYTWNYGLKLGASGFLGDVGGIDHGGRPWLLDMQPSQIRWDLGAYVRYKVTKTISVVGEFDWVRIQGADSISKYTPIRDRNLNFRNDIFEGSVRGEWTFYSNSDVGGMYNYTTSFNAYLFVGVGIFHDNPEAMVTHTWVDGVHNITYTAGDYYRLRDLTTEGEAPYKLIQPAIPLGIGFYYTINKSFRIGWDLCWDKTFTDYLDDVSGKYPAYGDNPNIPNPYYKYLTGQSQYVPGITRGELANYTTPGSPRGNPSNDDSFLTTSINIGYVIKGHLSQYMKGGFFHKVNYKSRASF